MLQPRSLRHDGNRITYWNGATVNQQEHTSSRERKHRARFDFGTSSVEEALARHVIATYRQGGSLADVLDSPYVRNRTNAAARRRLLDRSDVVEAIGAEVIDQLKAQRARRLDRWI